MAIEIKNNDTSSHTWGGKLYEAGEIYLLSSQKEHTDLYADNLFFTDLSSGKLEVYQSGVKLTNYSQAVNAVGLLPFIPPTDESSRPLYRITTTNDGWAYSPRSLDFYTAKYNSLYNRDHNGSGIDDGTDLGDALMKFFDASGTEMVKGESETDEEFQVRLTASCVKTFVDFEPTFDYDIFGCKLMIENAPSSRAYLWAIAVPDVPKAYGGSREFMGGGMNLKMMETKCIAYTDGKSSKTLKYDPTYHTNKIRIITKHAAGEQIGLQMIYDFYVE